MHRFLIVLECVDDLYIDTRVVLFFFFTFGFFLFFTCGFFLFCSHVDFPLLRCYILCRFIYNKLSTIMASAMITIYHLIFRVSHLEWSNLQIGRHAHDRHCLCWRGIKLKNLNWLSSVIVLLHHKQGEFMWWSEAHKKWTVVSWYASMLAFGRIWICLLVECYDMFWNGGCACQLEVFGAVGWNRSGAVWGKYLLVKYGCIGGRLW